MSNLAQRLLLFFICVPLIVAAIVFLPMAHHAVVFVIVLLISAAASLELASLFAAKGIEVNRPSFVLAGSLVPLAFFLSTFLPTNAAELAYLAVGLVAFALFTPYAFSRKENLPEALPAASAMAFALLYPGLFAGFVTLIISRFAFSTEAILCFALMVMGNDSLAWLFGVTMGRKRNLVDVSPNKSLAGFIGGFLGSCIVALGAKAAFPSAIQQPYWVMLVFGLVVGCSVIIGDLFESAIKRSAGVKDSGSLVPGRGGFLDSFDSILFSAPVFYAGSLALGLFS